MNETQCFELMEVLTMMGRENGGEFTTAQYMEAVKRVRRTSTQTFLVPAVVRFLSGCNCIMPLGKNLWYTSGFQLEDA